MVMSTEDPRFAGIARLYGIEGLERLRAAHVAIVGVGGVGSWAAEAMARCGVGEISLFDLDDVCVSNANRQLHALDSTVGKPKVEVMAERLRGINPDCTVHAVADFVTRDTMAEYITPNIDCVIDCIDAVNAKAALIAWCKRRKIQIITTGGAGGQIDPTLIQVCDLNRTFNDPPGLRLLPHRDPSLQRAVCVFHRTAALPETGRQHLSAEKFCRRRREARLRRRVWRGDDGYRDIWHGRGDQGCGQDCGGGAAPFGPSKTSGLNGEADDLIAGKPAPTGIG